MTRRLDNASIAWVYARDNYECQICGAHKDSLPPRGYHWSHYIGRSNLVLRHFEINAIGSCYKCHMDWHNGLCTPMIDAINKKWGDDTHIWLERIAGHFPHSRGTFLDCEDFRLELEDFYKEKLKVLTADPTLITELNKTLMTDYGRGDLNELR